MKKTTIGRFWGYVSVFVSLGVSLAGNVKAAYLHDPDPGWVTIGFAGIPPLAAFLSIEIVNHNPWENEEWGPWVRKILLGVVAPASAIVSFIHLVTVVVDGRLDGTGVEQAIIWITAVLTALLIDGLMFGGTAALLLRKTAAVVSRGIAVEAYPNWRDEVARQVAAMTPVAAQVAAAAAPEPVRPNPVVRPKSPTRKVAGGAKQRIPATAHPLFPEWAAAKRSGSPWSAADLARRLGDESAVGAAAARINRWNKELAKV